MLRITTAKPASETITEGTSTGVAAGDPVTPPPVEFAHEAGPIPMETAIEGNHGAAIIPWLESELVFHSVLDMACGDGTAVSGLAALGRDAWGIDLAPTAANISNIITGDMFSVGQESGYFDLVMCCNTAHELSPVDVGRLFAEIDRLSNSYIMITVPSPEFSTEARPVSWWAQRAEDFGWRFRFVREDPDANQLALMFEKADSLAAKILPLLDENGEIPNASTNVADSAATQGQAAEAVSLAGSILDSLRLGDDEEAFGKLANLASMLLESGLSMGALNPILLDIVEAMEKKDRRSLVSLIETRLIPGLESI